MDAGARGTCAADDRRHHRGADPRRGAVPCGWPPAPRRKDAGSTSPFTPAPGTDISALFRHVFGFRRSRFEAARRSARRPVTRAARSRAILGVAIFGGVYFVFVTVVEVMGLAPTTPGSRPSRSRPRYG
jgi:hypothetical protein